MHMKDITVNVLIIEEALKFFRKDGTVGNG